MDDFRQMAARVKGMQMIEEKVCAALRHHGLKLRAQDLAWNRDRPYEPTPDSLELTIRLGGGTPILQQFSRHEVERCAAGIRSPDTAMKIQGIAEQLQKLKPRGKNGNGDG